MKQYVCHARSVRSIPSTHLFTKIGRLQAPSLHELISPSLVTLSVLRESERNAIRIVGVIVVQVAVAIDITEIVAVVAISRPQPPIVS